MGGVKILSAIIRVFIPIEKRAHYAGVNFGNNNLINDEFWDASEPYLITIGSNCQITRGVKIYTHGGSAAVRRWLPDFDTFGKVKIGDFVYIGNDSKIMPGVTIGDNVLIAAGSIVTKSIPSNVVVAGNPAKYVCKIEEFIERNKKYNINSKQLDIDAKKKLLLSLVEDKFIKKPMLQVP